MKVTQPVRHFTDEGFKRWMGKVDDAVEAILGIDTTELPDVSYREWFENGMRPGAAARKTIKNAGD
jgi:hypothetical protein